MRIPILLIISLFLSSTSLLAQNDLTFEVLTPNYENKRPCKDAVVSIYTGGELMSELQSTTKNGVVMKLALGEFYKIVISAPGRVTRFFNVDLTNASFSREDADMLNLGVRINLFKEVEAVDYSYVLTHPVVTYYYDSELEIFTFDLQQPKLMAAKIEELLSGKTE